MKWSYLYVTAHNGRVNQAIVGEERKIKLEGTEISIALAQLGEEGWELVATSRLQFDDKPVTTELYFKRALD